ncbi:energy transducer TonB [Pedobacter sp. Leaf250]|uniref:energy transducer TonB n=1 Tax=Pedobacter sp. Leaf250 TaxID=2876559 RepID=UPI001202A3FF|nr:energy transducer TonB [Pedobacter sp. Leaf250]RZL37919.1 MAG: hypothetical protein EOO96_04025 [Pedobacter sp.]
MKRTLLTLLTIAIPCFAFSQKRSNVYYFKDGVPVKNNELADYRRVIEEPDPGSKFYNFYEYYADNTDKATGKLSKFEPNLVYEGELKRFNKKGILIEKTNYVNGKPIGESSSYYANGQLARVILYPEAEKSESQKRSSYKVISGFDSLGVQFIKDGNGHLNINESEEGDYLDGYKNGEWKGKIGKDSYVEHYDSGYFINGIATFENGSTKKYKVAEEKPEFPGGITEFYKYLGKSFKYPTEALRNKISGKLFIGFVVEKDGKLTNYKFKNDLGYGTREEAMRVLDECPNWNPGLQHGIPVKVSYNININLAQR